MKNGIEIRWHGRGGQGNDALAKAHVQEHRRNGMLQDEVRGVGLVFMRTVFHRVSLQSALDCQCGTPKSPGLPTAVSALSAKAGAPCRVLSAQ